MHTYIKGELVEITPTQAVIENNGIGYELQISLQTFTEIQSLRDVMLYIHHHLREDVELWYGFATKDERNIFRMLYSKTKNDEVNSSFLVVGVSGLEPPTPTLSGWCSNRLSYTPILNCFVDPTLYSFALVFHSRVVLTRLNAYISIV